jgi:hypothetical protein
LCLACSAPPPNQEPPRAPVDHRRLRLALLPPRSASSGEQSFVQASPRWHPTWPRPHPSAARANFSPVRKLSSPDLDPQPCTEAPGSFPVITHGPYRRFF